MNYEVQYRRPNYLRADLFPEWMTVKKGSKQYCLGYFDAAQNQFPRPAMRVCKSDDETVVTMSGQQDDVSVGQIAGWILPEQLELAANRALHRAQMIREQQARQEERRANRK